MRIVYICRLFSGLSDGLREGVWEPRGVPTVYRLIEALEAAKHELHLIFTIKDEATAWPKGLPETFPVPGLQNPVTVVPQHLGVCGLRLPRNGYTREIGQYFRLHRIIKKKAPDLLYFDRANIYGAALTAHRTKVPVVWRVMGVPPPMHKTLTQKGWVAAGTRKAYKAPFSMVICSKDGSGGHAWMQKALHPNTPRHTLLNGVDLPGQANPTKSHLSVVPERQATNVLFVSRLVEEKGCLDFVRAACKVLDAEENSFHFIVAGSGPYESEMRAMAASSGHTDKIQFLGQVKHGHILHLHQLCDIYVSLNTMGNLTNANLEAMRSGICIIMPRARGQFDIDVDTEQLIPEDLAWRINSSGIINGLSEALLYLAKNPKEIEKRAKGIARLANKVIPSWNERVANEIAILETLTPN